MKVFVISDLHLSFASNKPMDIFGWGDHFSEIKKNWLEKVGDEDIVLMPGDFSWAINMTEVLPDVQAVGDLPGKKVIIKGNHDYWWSSYSKVNNLLNRYNMFAVQNNSIRIENILICGTRLWQIPNNQTSEEDIKIFNREVLRLKMTLDDMQKQRREGDKVVLMLHYPPFMADLKNSEVTDIIEKYDVKLVVYGHLHGNKVRKVSRLYKNGVTYLLTSCDHLNNNLIEITNLF